MDDIIDAIENEYSAVENERTLRVLAWARQEILNIRSQNRYLRKLNGSANDED